VASCAQSPFAAADRVVRFGANGNTDWSPPHLATAAPTSARHRAPMQCTVEGKHVDAPDDRATGLRATRIHSPCSPSMLRCITAPCPARLAAATTWPAPRGAAGSFHLQRTYLRVPRRVGHSVGGCGGGGGGGGVWFWRSQVHQGSPSRFSRNKPGHICPVTGSHLHQGWRTRVHDRRCISACMLPPRRGSSRGARHMSRCTTAA
jgi:hypothetical protein